MDRDIRVRRNRPSRARTRRRHPARTLAAVTLFALTGGVMGTALASDDVRDAAMTAVGAREPVSQQAEPAEQTEQAGRAGRSNPTPDPGEGGEAASRASAAVGPITAPGKAPEVPTPRVSVSPGIDMDLHSLDDPASPWVVVNKARPLNPESWAPPELDSSGGAAMVPEASEALAVMRATAADAGVQISVGSGYRAYGFQQSLYLDYVSRWGRERADRFSARPGHSEHQTGLAVDVFGSLGCRLKECFADEPAGQWVAERGHEFGFLVRYGPDSEPITGYKHEPWHLRYVGVELATEMHERDIATMEEFFSLDPAPSYG